MKKWVPVILSSSLIIPGAAVAVGLGKLKINSSLNQPINANINLLGVNGIALGDVKVYIAGPSRFEEMGIDQSNELSKFKFEVLRNKAGQPVIRITSKEPIQNPYIDLLLDVRWPGGELFRNYSVMLDPAEYLIHKTVPKPKSHSRKQTQRATQASSKAMPTMAKQLAKSAVSRTEKQTKPTPQIKAVKFIGPVQKTEDLFVIAKQVHGQYKANVEQIMLGILRANPGAFKQKNINGLYSGVKLRLPSQALVSAIPPADAIVFVKQHNDSWHKKEIIHFTYPAVAEQQITRTQQELVEKTTQNAPATMSEAQNINQRDTVKSNTTTERARPALSSAELNKRSKEHLQGKYKASLVDKMLDMVVTEKASQQPQANKTASVHLQGNPNVETQIAEQKTNNITSNAEQRLQAELAISAQAANSAQQATDVLREEIVDLRGQNQDLLKRLQQKEVEIAEIRKELGRLAVLSKQSVTPGVSAARAVKSSGDIQINAISGQSNTAQPDDGTQLSRKLIFLAALLLLGAGGYYYFAFHNREALEALLNKLGKADAADNKRRSRFGGITLQPVEEDERVTVVGQENFAADDRQTPEEYSPEPMAEPLARETSQAETRVSVTQDQPLPLQPEQASEPAASVEITESDVKQAFEAKSEAQPLSEAETAVEAEPEINDEVETETEETEHVLEFDPSAFSSLTAKSQQTQTEETDTQASETPSEDDDGNMLEFEVTHDAEPESFSDVTDGDEIAAKIDLATAYINMEDFEPAKALLEEVIQLGTSEQKAQAQGLLDSIDKFSR